MVFGSKTICRFRKFKRNALLKKHPDNDSLRTYIGGAYLDNGYDEDAYKTIYPLFENHHIKAPLKKRVQQELSYLSYNEQKKMYVKYPDLFQEKLRKNLII